LTTQCSGSIMRYNLAQDTMSIRNPLVVSGMRLESGLSFSSTATAAFQQTALALR
jgi:hypothetical protein